MNGLECGSTVAQQFYTFAHCRYAIATKDGQEIVPISAPVMDGARLHKFYRDEKDNRCGIIYLTGHPHNEEFRSALLKKLGVSAHSEPDETEDDRAPAVARPRAEVEDAAEAMSSHGMKQCAFCDGLFAQNIYSTHLDHCTRMQNFVRDATFAQQSSAS